MNLSDLKDALSYCSPVNVICPDCEVVVEFCGDGPIHQHEPVKISEVSIKFLKEGGRQMILHIK